MGNGQIHPDEKKLAKRLGDDYITEHPPEGAEVVGKDVPPPEELPVASEAEQEAPG